MLQYPAICGGCMDNLTYNIDKILKCNKSLSSEFGKYSRIYFHTTENIIGFLRCFDLKDKDILTVAGSGDQMLNAYLMGAKNVTCFDINPLAFAQVQLKRGAVCSLSYDEYLDFFFGNNCLDWHLFEKSQGYLDENTLELFDYLYSNYTPQEIYNSIYYRIPYDIDNIRRMNGYLDRDNYAKLGMILKEKTPTFIESDITQLKSRIGQLKFDMILFSNISDSINKIYTGDDLEILKKYKRLIHSFIKSLNSFGTIQVGYIYDYYIKGQDSLFACNSKRNIIFTSDEFHGINVESYRWHSDSDEVIIYQKTK